MPSCLPNRPQTLEDDIQCLHPREYLALAHSIPKHLHKKKKPGMRFRTKVNNGKSELWTYLIPIAVSLFKVGCHIEGRVKEILTSHCLREL
jgi:hypothetical protein